MGIEAENYGRSVVLNVTGELTEDVLTGLAERVEHELEQDQVLDVIVNMAEAPFLDSVALAYLLELQDRLREKLGQVKLAGCDPNVKKILEMTRLDVDFETYDEVAAAVKAAQS